MPKVSHALLHRARGAIVGAAVGEAMARCADEAGAWPAPRLGGSGELTSPWGPHAAAMVDAGEAAARGELPAFDAGAAAIVAVAVNDAVTGAGAPLLTDTASADVHGLVTHAVGGGSSTDGDSAGQGWVGEADKCAAEPTFGAAVEGAWGLGGDTAIRALVAGALCGARLGVTAIPSRWLTYVHGPGRQRVHHMRDLLRLADRLVGHELRFPPDPRRAIGPVEVVDGVYAANIFRVRSFCESHPEGAVISMCPMGDRLDDHPVRRSFLIDDVATVAANPRLDQVVDELLETIAAFRAEARPVLVHCHHGVSRTGLALRAWLMRETGLGEADATTEVEAGWPWLSTANERFTRVLAARDRSE